MKIPEKSNNKFIALGVLAIACMIPVSIHMSKASFGIKELDKSMESSSQLVTKLKNNPEFLQISSQAEVTKIDGIDVAIEDRKGLVVGKILDEKAKGAMFIHDGDSKIILDGDKNVIFFEGDREKISEDIITKIDSMRQGVQPNEKLKL